MRQKLDAFFAQANEVLLDKENQVRLAMTCFLANGHLLIEDIPGVGKTTMVHLFARSMSLEFSRVQFTNDLLPSDILGNSIFDAREQKFHFHAGPIFGELILADELNRATPKTQSALLQAMEEKEVSVDGTTHKLPRPFFVVATQNSRQQAGTFPLPESELDRFLMRLSFGYPSRAGERKLLMGEDRRDMLEKLSPLVGASELVEAQGMVKRVRASEAVIDYIQDVLDASRSGRWECQGLSPRAGLALTQSAKAWAWIAGREMVVPEDVQAVAASIAATPEAAARLAREILTAIEVN